MARGLVMGRYYDRKSKDDSMKILIACVVGGCISIAIAIAAKLLGY